ncbi:MAG TPA: ribonuclease III [Acidimicrobiales bacterium]|nr:ribonuclease III [Acidimicrobiales bacterium]
MAPAPQPETTAGQVWLAEQIDYLFSEPELLDQALAHRSWCAEQGESDSNERLEYLGDAVLGLVVAEHTYRTYPELSDGAMSKVRASVVNTRALAEIALELGIAAHLRLGRGEDQSGGRAKESILADATEAVIGAVYLDGGLDEARRMILALLRDRIAAAVGEPGVSDHKSRLQEETVRLGRGVPQYEVEGSGPDHARKYVAAVYVAGQRLGTGEGRSKKDAEQVAAEAAYGSLVVERGRGDA